MINKDRLNAITDAIIAVAATIMVLRLDIPEKASLAAAHEQWPILLSYAISFTQIFLGWHEHHDMFIHIKRINHRIFLVNCFWLMAITLIPFVTGMVGQNPNARASLFLYIAILVLQNVVMMAESNMIVKLNGRNINDAEVIRKLRIVTLIGYAVAVMATIIRPIFGLIVIVAICVANIAMMWIADGKQEECLDK